MNRWKGIAVLSLLAACGDDNEEGSSGTAISEGKKSSAVLFDDNELNDFHLTIDPADWESIVWDTRGDVYRTADLRWKGIEVRRIGVRPSGSSTRYPGNQKMSLKLKFDAFVPDQMFVGLKTLKLDGLREGTMIRERLSYDVFRARLQAVPRAVHGLLHVNGEYRGVYLVEERVTGAMMRDRTGVDEAGNLYRIRVDSPEAFAWQGSDPDRYIPDAWEPETNEDTGDHGIVPDFLDVLNNRPGELGAVVDLENLTEYLALEAAVISRDGVLRDEGPPHNFYMYHRPETGRFELVPWDIDNSWSRGEATRSLYWNFGNTRLAAVVRETPALDALYRRKLAEILESVTRPSRLAGKIDFIYAQIRDAAHADPYKLWSNAEIDGVPAYLKDTAQRRYDSLRSQLAGP